MFTPALKSVEQAVQAYTLRSSLGFARSPVWDSVSGPIWDCIDEQVEEPIRRAIEQLDSRASRLA